MTKQSDNNDNRVGLMMECLVETKQFLYMLGIAVVTKNNIE